MLAPMTTMLERLSDEATTTIDEVLPPVGRRVIVQCDGFRCIGVCNANGIWVDIFNNQPLPPVLWFKHFGSRKK